MGTVFRFGPYECHPRSRELYKHGLKLKIRPQPVQVLNLLLSRAGDVVTREELRNELWPTDTFVDFEHGLNTSIRELRAALDDSAAGPRYVETLPRLGYRFIGTVTRQEKPSEWRSEAVDGPALSALPAHKAGKKNTSPWPHWAGITALILLIVAAGGFAYRKNHRAVAGEKSKVSPIVGPVEKDMIVLTDFANKTGDPVFDETLKQALSMELTQSPNLNVASSLQVQEMLRRMNREPNAEITREVGAEVCSRMSGKAIIAGTITKLGSDYVIGLEALGCENGTTLGLAQAEAGSKESVLKAMDQAASQLRGKLGESLPNLQRYNFPLNATTSSLDALKAFSMGMKAEQEKHPVEGIPYYKEAIRLDPNFGLAYAVLGRAYEDIGEDEQATSNYIQAYRLRDRMSERERYFITTLYEESVTGNLEKAREAGELWVETYPSDGFAREKLGTVYSDLGEIDKLVEQAQEALRLNPNSEVNVFNAAAGLITANRPEEANQVLQSAQSRGLNGPAILAALYVAAFYRQDMPEMERLVSKASGEAAVEAMLLAMHSETLAFFGRLQKARETSIRAVASAKKAGEKETAANSFLVSALREIEIGNPADSAQQVRSALSLAPTRNVKIQAALAWARSGETSSAKLLLSELKRKYPDNTLVHSYWGPAILASIDIREGNPRAAIADLKVAAPYELSQAPPFGDDLFFYPTYIRGEAYLAVHDGASAASEFKKVLDHPGVAVNCILYPLSRLQLARATAMAGDQAEARSEYEHFLSFWEQSDPDIPVLRQARSELARLQSPAQGSPPPERMSGLDPHGHEKRVGSDLSGTDGHRLPSRFYGTPIYQQSKKSPPEGHKSNTV
jgi:eukaryotic-like serine/threonine-protein kinase